jgi:CheY-like chemotaxis protein
MASILVIEDDEQLRETVRKILGVRGHQVSLAANGMEGLRLFRTVQPELVITDIVMPVKEGLDTIRLLRTWVPDAKIIAMSGSLLSREKDPLKAAEQLGASKVLAKPFRAEQLLEIVDECLAA